MSNRKNRSEVDDKRGTQRPTEMSGKDIHTPLNCTQVDNTGTLDGPSAIFLCPLPKISLSSVSQYHRWDTTVSRCLFPCPNPAKGL